MNEIYSVCKSNWKNGYKRNKGLEEAKKLIPSITEELYGRVFRNMIYNELGVAKRYKSWN